MIGDRWGVSDPEVRRRYPCDDFVAAPTMQAWRGVTVPAPAEDVWPWVTQIRLAPYSYDWLDNLGRRSPRRLQGPSEPQVGDPFTCALGGKPFGAVLAVRSHEHLTGRILGAVMSYVLVPVDGGRTRLLLKIVAAPTRLLAAPLCLGDLVMARKQLRTLAQLARR